MKGYNNEWIVECWSLHYHVYKFLKSGGNLKDGIKRWNRKRVEYFWNWMITNGELV